MEVLDSAKAGYQQQGQHRSHRPEQNAINGTNEHKVSASASSSNESKQKQSAEHKKEHKQVKATDPNNKNNSKCNNGDTQSTRPHTKEELQRCLVKTEILHDA